MDHAVVVGTAGHIDHGKTSLVRSLTGIDLDTLPEEKSRGITIALGFAPLRLPDGRTLSVVDVPGHERLIRTMVAGATGLDAVVLCVSAAEGVMPQTREHLAILDLLGVQDGFVVLTMADLVDAELLELARLDVEDAVAGSFLAGKPIVAWSAPRADGRDEVLAALGTLGPRKRSAAGRFRLPVDRAFVRPGFGTVVTGTAWSGTVRDGDAVTVLPEGITAKVRGIQVHGVAASRSQAGSRTAINLSGVERADLDRGSVVVTGSVPCASILDVRYRHLDGAPRLADGDAVRVLHGTAERLGRFVFAEPRDAIDGSGECWAQIRLEAPLPCEVGDRFIVRRPSPQQTLGGGRVVDPWARRIRSREREAASAELARLDAGDRQVWLERAGEEGLRPSDWVDRGGEGGEWVGERVFAAGVVARFEALLTEAIHGFHRDQPLALGASRRELRRGRLAHLSDRTFDALVERLARRSIIEVEGPLLRRTGFQVALDPRLERLRGAIRHTIGASALEGIPGKKLSEAHPDPATPELVRLLEAAGEVENVPDTGYTLRSALDELAVRVRGWFDAHVELSPADFKELTGLSRKSAIPLLEWLDRARVTRRRADVRVRGDERSVERT